VNNDAFAVLADAYLDGSLDEEQAARLLAWLRASPAAATHLRAVAAIDLGLRGQAGRLIDAATARRGVQARILATGGGQPFRAAVERRIAESLGTQGSRRHRLRHRWRSRAGWPVAGRLAAAAIVLVAVIAGAALYRQQGAAPAAGMLAVVESAQGWVTVEHGEQSETAGVQRGLAAGDVLVTAPEAAATVRLADGTRLHLTGSAAMRLPAPDGARVRLERGDLAVEVVPQAIGAPPIVSTALASVSVLGTVFTLSARPEATLLHVREGVVAVSAGAGREWRVAAGESLRVTALRSERTTPLALRRGGRQPWHAGNARPLAGLVDFTAPQKASPRDPWGGRADRALAAAGDFRVERVAGRWWLVDPAGHPLILAAVSDVRHVLGNDDPTLRARFGDAAGWASATSALLAAHDFNAVGSFSETSLLDAARTARGGQPIDLVTANVAGDFAKAFLRDRPRLAGDATLKAAVRLLAPLLPGFGAHVAQWERSLKGALQPAVAAGLITDRFGSAGFDPDALRRLAAADGQVRVVLATWLGQRDLADVGPAEVAMLRRACLAGYVAQVYAAARRAAPRTLLYGMVIGLGATFDDDVMKVLVPAVDVVPVHLIGTWIEDPAVFSQAAERFGRPLLIDGFYAKGADSGLPNVDGNGLEVPTQADRARFYQHVALLMLESRAVIGWQWYRYADAGEGPFRTIADLDSNKGIVDPHFAPHQRLLDGMAELNRQRYALIDYFDR
jgi:ferric-dicitrate binding protein FerR (iron transport regulator)